MLKGIDYSLLNIWQNILQNRSAQTEGWDVKLKQDIAF